MVGAVAKYLSNRKQIFCDYFKVERKSIVVLVLVSCGIVKAQGPWIREIKKSYLQIGFSALSYQAVRYNTLVLDTNRNNYDITNQLYFEYGFNKKVELTLIAPYKFLGYESKLNSNQSRMNGFGNICVGVKYGLINKKLKLSTGAFLSVNTIKKSDLTGLRTGFEASTIKPHITVGGSSNLFYYYFNAAYGVMTNNYSDYLELSGELGYKMIKKTHFILSANLKEPTTKESFFSSDKSSYHYTANYLDRQKYFVLGLKINYEFIENKYGVNLGIINGLNGRLGATNIPVSRSYNTAFYCKF